MRALPNLVVIPISGLANRLRVMISGIKLQKHSRKNLAIFWEKDAGLNAEFKQLFIGNSHFPVVDTPMAIKFWLWMKTLPFNSSVFGRQYLKLLKFDFVFLDEMVSKVWSNEIDLQQMVTNSKRSFMCSCQELNYYDEEDFL